MKQSRQPQSDNVKPIGSWPALLLCVLLVISGLGVNGADVVRFSC